jgi:hypothetical protein
MGPVAVAEAEVVDDVGPLPAALRGDRRDAVGIVLEDGGETRAGQPGVAGRDAGLPDPGVRLGRIERIDLGVVVERDRDMVPEEALGAFLIGRRDLDDERLDPIAVGRQLEGPIVDARLEVLERAVAGPGQGARAGAIDSSDGTSSSRPEGSRIARGMSVGRSPGRQAERTIGT